MSLKNGALGIQQKHIIQPGIPKPIGNISYLTYI